MDDIGLTPMRAARLSGQCRAVAGTETRLASVLMNVAHEKANNEKDFDTVNTTRATRPLTHIAQPVTPAPFAPIAAQPVAPASLADMIEQITRQSIMAVMGQLAQSGVNLASLAQTVQPVPAAPKLMPRTENVKWCQVGDQLILVINANPATVQQPAPHVKADGTTSAPRYAGGILAQRGHGTSTLYAGVNAVTITVGVGDGSAPSESSLQVDPDKIASAVLGVPQSAIADMLAVYRNAHPTT